MESFRIISSDDMHIIISLWKMSCGKWCDLDRKTTTRWKLCSEAIGRRSWRKWVILWRAGLDLEEGSMLQSMIKRLWKIIWDPQDWNNKRLCRVRLGCILELFVLFWSYLCCPVAVSLLAELAGSQDGNSPGCRGTTLAPLHMKRMLAGCPLCYFIFG